MSKAGLIAKLKIIFNDLTAATADDKATDMGTDIYDEVAGGLSHVVEDLTPQLGGDLDLNGHNLDFPTTPNISDCLDEDNMASNSATKLATQQSIKAYVDSQTHGLLDNYFDTGWINRSDWTNVHLGCIVLDYDNLSGSFTVGATVTGGTTGDTGVILSDSGSTLVLSDVTSGGIFQDGEQLTDDATGVTADVNEGSGSAKNQDQDVTHGLGANLSDLLVKVLISTDGTDANSFEICSVSHNTSNEGYVIYQVDTNNVKVQIGSSGILYFNDSGSAIRIDTEDWYYKIMVYKLK